MRWVFDQHIAYLDSNFFKLNRGKMRLVDNVFMKYIGGINAIKLHGK